MHFVVSLAGLFSWFNFGHQILLDLKFTRLQYWHFPTINRNTRASQRDFSSMGHVVEEIYSEVAIFPHFWPQNKPLSGPPIQAYANSHINMRKSTPICEKSEKYAK